MQLSTPTPTTSAILHLVTDRQTDRQTDRRQYSAKGQLLRTAEVFILLQDVCYRMEDRAMPLLISIRIEFYNGIVRFFSHSTAFVLVFVCRLE